MQWSYDPPYTIHYKGCEFDLTEVLLNLSLFTCLHWVTDLLCVRILHFPDSVHNVVIMHMISRTGWTPPILHYAAILIPTPHPPLSLRQKPRVPHWDHSTTWVLQYHSTTVASFGLRCPMQWFTNPPLLVDHNCGIGANFYNRGFDDIKYTIPMCPIKNAQINRF